MFHKFLMSFFLQKPLHIMKHIFTLACVLLFYHISLGQNIAPAPEDTALKKISIEIEGNFTAKSNAFTNNFYYTFYRGGYLSDAQKQMAVNHLKNVNRWGADADIWLHVKYKADSILKSSGWSITAHLAERRHLNLNMTKDFFNTGFFGNALYENKTAQLAHFRVNFISYQQAGLGIEKQWKCARGSHQLGFIANYLNGRNAQQINIEKADLFTATDGDYVTLDINGSMHKAHTLKSKKIIQSPTRGTGMSMDVYYRFVNDKNNQFLVTLSDWGFITWKNTAQYYHYDTLFRFEGIPIPDLIQLNDSLIQLSTDSLKKLGDSKEFQSFTTPIPAWIKLRYTHTIVPHKLALVSGVNYRFDYSYIPFIYTGASYSINTNLNVFAGLGYGGYGQLNYSLAAQYFIVSKIIVKVETKQLEGWVLPKKANGQSLLFSVKFML